jgi:hypothetical protein
MFWRSFFLPSVEYKKSSFLEVDGLGFEDGGTKLRETSVTLYKSTQRHIRKGLNVSYVVLCSEWTWDFSPIGNQF